MAPESAIRDVAWRVRYSSAAVASAAAATQREGQGTCRWKRSRISVHTVGHSAGFGLTLPDCRPALSPSSTAVAFVCSHAHPR